MWDAQFYRNQHDGHFCSFLIFFSIFGRQILLPWGVCSGRDIAITQLIQMFVRTQVFSISNDSFSRSSFCKRLFQCGLPQPFIQYKRAYLGHALSLVIYAGMVLFAYFESIQWCTRTFFPFFQKKFSLALQIKLKIGDQLID